MDKATKSHAWPPVGAYTTGHNYGRYLRGFLQRYGLKPLSEAEATAHAYRMADPYTGNDASEFVRGVLVGYGLEAQEEQAHTS